MVHYFSPSAVVLKHRHIFVNLYCLTKYNISGSVPSLSLLCSSLEYQSFDTSQAFPKKGINDSKLIGNKVLLYIIYRSLDCSGVRWLISALNSPETLENVVIKQI